MKKLSCLLLALSLVLSLAACGSTGGAKGGSPAPGSSAAVKSGVEDGVLTIALECAYAPYNSAPCPSRAAPSTPTGTIS